MATQISIPDSQATLKGIMEGLIGETCHQVDFSYGDELQLDFGEMTAYAHPKLAHLSKGSWQLSTRATEWTLRQNNKVLISEIDNYNKAEIDPILWDLNNPEIAVLHKVQQLQGKKMNDFIIDVNSMGLILFFEDNYQLVLKTDLQDDSGLSYWELMLPNEQILIVGPGLSWQCKSIHDLV
ncbi:hypothetical protein [Pseudanabaena sp. ABRG5-3]|uniref:hypothetical protein n=1 Tax=Pseudanabaena sp. ABRG5-3 TaxID=685565 RepID=UPI000DC71989|nr:hypothetical protein [Pseudanabaena sp. ABRG5-3]BBC23491.1 hypothetical protein ABRG53_1234 [Pseudanabaena sp. ABRG5-3]